MVSKANVMTLTLYTLLPSQQVDLKTTSTRSAGACAHRHRRRFPAGAGSAARRCAGPARAGGHASTPPVDGTRTHRRGTRRGTPRPCRAATPLLPQTPPAGTPCHGLGTAAQVFAHPAASLPLLPLSLRSHVNCICPTVRAGLHWYTSKMEERKMPINFLGNRAAR